MPEPLTHADSIVIAAPRSVVYAAISDVTRTGEWSPVCRECWWDEGGGPWVGSFFTGRNVTPTRTWETRCEVIVADADAAFGWSVAGGNVLWTYRLEDVPWHRTDRIMGLHREGPELLSGAVRRRGRRRDRLTRSRGEEGIPATLAAIKRAIEGPCLVYLT